MPTGGGTIGASGCFTAAFPRGGASAGGILPRVADRLPYAADRGREAGRCQATSGVGRLEAAMVDQGLIGGDDATGLALRRCLK